jgi:hypothetical protein
MKDVEFATSSRSVGRDDEILRPGENVVDRNVLSNPVSDRDMLGGVPIVSNVGLEGYAFAKVFGSWLQETEVLPVATHDDYCYEDRHPG